MADSVAMEFVQSNLAAVAAVVVGTLSAGAFLLSSRSPSPPSAAPSQPSAKKQPSGGKAPTAASVAPASGSDAAAPEKKKKKKNKKKKAAAETKQGSDDGAEDDDDNSDSDEMPATTNKKKGTAAPAASSTSSPKKAKGGASKQQASATPAVVEEPVKVPSPAKSKLPEAKENEWEIAKPAKSGNSGNKKKTPKPAAAAVAAAAAPVPGMGGGANDAAASAAPAVKGRVEVTTKKLGVIIGPGGETMKKLQEATGTRINTPPKGEQAGLVTIVTVEGSAEGVAACSRAIRDLAEKGYSTITHPNFNEGSVQMFPMYFHILIGKEGSGIRALENAFNIKVVMPAQRVTDDSKPQYVKLVGSKASIERAKAEIKAMMKCYYFPTVTPGLTHVEIDLPEGQLRDLIGHRGATIKSIQGDTKCRIHTPKPQSVNPKVVVVGAPADVARAQTQITRALERAVENREARYNERFDDYDEDYDDEEY